MENFSNNGLTYTFELRRGVKFHNGAEMTAEDVKWSLDYVLDPKNAALGRSRLLLISKVEVPASHTVRIHLTTPSAPFLGYLTDIGVLLIAPKGSVPPGTNKLDAAPPGTGPFQLVSW